MIKSIIVTNPQGESLSLELKRPETSGLFVRRVDGLGPSKVNVNMGESLYQDGSYYNSSRVTSRNIVFDLGFYNSLPFMTIEQIRLQTYRFFPSKKPLLIRIETDTRTALVVGYLESNEPDIFSKNSGAIISLVCPDAFLYGESIIETLNTGISGGFEFPWENTSLVTSTLEFGIIYTGSNATVNYGGDAPTGLVFVMTLAGAIYNIIITNEDTGEEFFVSADDMATLTGEFLQAGDVVTISTVRGNRYINILRDSVVWNVLNAVDVDSVWFQIDKGPTEFSVTSDGGASNISYAIYHQSLYEGV